jgi:ubiquinone/menaquinone biosynthesis C-methylase UbiE
MARIIAKGINQKTFIRNSSAKYYNSIAKGYNELHGEEQGKKMEIIRKRLDIKKSDKLLDVGCGTGLSSGFECECYGIDPSSKLLEQNPLPSERKRVAKAEKIPYPDRFFDAVVCVSAVHNFDDIEKGLKEMKRVGKQKFVITALKKSPKKDMIISLIRSSFKVNQEIEGEKDIIFFLS